MRGLAVAAAVVLATALGPRASPTDDEALHPVEPATGEAATNDDPVEPAIHEAATDDDPSDPFEPAIDDASIADRPCRELTRTECMYARHCTLVATSARPSGSPVPPSARPLRARPEADRSGP